MLAKTEYVTVPSPLPLLPDMIETQLSLGVAVQGQSPADELTLKLPSPPPDGNNLLAGDIEYVQGTPC